MDAVQLAKLLKDNKAPKYLKDTSKGKSLKQFIEENKRPDFVFYIANYCGVPIEAQMPAISKCINAVSHYIADDLLIDVKAFFNYSAFYGIDKDWLSKIAPVSPVKYNSILHGYGICLAVEVLTKFVLYAKNQETKSTFYSAINGVYALAQIPSEKQAVRDAANLLYSDIIKYYNQPPCTPK
jgi:hypothetical protein